MPILLAAADLGPPTSGLLFQMPHRTDFTIRLSATDRYRHCHIRERSRIIFFRVQLETQIQGSWYPVVRYDTAHGFAHRDLLSYSGVKQKTPLFEQDYNDALIIAENDLKLNWQSYKKRFLESAP